MEYSLVMNDKSDHTIVSLIPILCLLHLLKKSSYEFKALGIRNCSKMCPSASTPSSVYSAGYETWLAAS